MATMNGFVPPSGGTVQHVKADDSEPGQRQVLLRMKASSICASYVRAIYREHLGHRAGRPTRAWSSARLCGQAMAAGPGCRWLRVGDRVAE
jgi:threonine dehydrogenase-like Zn-dependent dehydrogenase